jgi:hypothetical protein
VTRICIDLNVWCGAILSQAHGRSGTAAGSIVDAVRQGACRRGALTLIISWGMIDRLTDVLARDLMFPPEIVADLAQAIVGFADEGPSLTLGGVGVLPIHDTEDRHVLETAWSGRADILTTADLRGFVSAEAEVLVRDRVFRLRRADHPLIVAHPFETAAWLRGEAVFGREVG